MRVKMSKQPPPAPTASAIGPCPTVIQIVGRPGTGSLPSTIAPPDHPSQTRLNWRYKVIGFLVPNESFIIIRFKLVGWLVVLGLTAL